jgi:predicted RNA-binding Zn-ribbon protein involved in translation (DUF1610 family)
MNGIWTDVWRCKNCGFLTPDILVMGLYTPCPMCGSDRIEMITARKAYTHTWRRLFGIIPLRKTTYHWQLRRDYLEAVGDKS